MLDIKPVDLPTMIDHGCRVNPPAPKPSGSSSGWRLAAQGAEISCDPQRLQQVLWNLLVNAVKFTRLAAWFYSNSTMRR